MERGPGQTEGSKLDQLKYKILLWHILNGNLIADKCPAHHQPLMAVEQDSIASYSSGTWPHFRWVIVALPWQAAQRVIAQDARRATMASVSLFHQLKI
jgi:hypothetical protein